ncbi:hypothetical protein [Catellatospora sp. NPDC049609]|uniref:hypothetical protein n=1 Tax=Catellatospora sp. NPDC049609 TaxID=3155505 RepID=UPI00344369B8
MPKYRRRRSAAEKSRADGSALERRAQRRAAQAEHAEARTWLPAAEPAFVAGAIGFVASLWLALVGVYPLAPAVAVGSCLLNAYAVYVLRKGAEAGGDRFPFRMGNGNPGAVVAGALGVASVVVGVAAFLAH